MTHIGCCRVEGVLWGSAHLHICFVSSALRQQPVCKRSWVILQGCSCVSAYPKSVCLQEQPCLQSPHSCSPACTKSRRGRYRTAVSDGRNHNDIGVSATSPILVRVLPLQEVLQGLLAVHCVETPGQVNVSEGHRRRFHIQSFQSNDTTRQ